MRHKIMVCINLMNECINHASTLHQGGQLEVPIDLLAQSAALFCPYISSNVLVLWNLNIIAKRMHYRMQ